MQFILFFLFLGAVLLSLTCRVKIRMRSMGRGYPQDLPTEPKGSVFSRALTELVATAGGIYISMLLLFSFLNVPAPGLVSVFGIEADLLASLSLGVAVIQPIIINIYQKHFI